MKKRWIIIGIVILAIIGVVLTIVFVNLFREKDTKDLALSVNNTVENGYLSEESDEYQTIIEYLEAMDSAGLTVEEKTEVKNYLNSYKAYTIIGDFYNRQIVFSEYSEAYKTNRKKIKNDFSSAQSLANKLMAFIDDSRQVVGGSVYWQANTWATCKDDVKALFEKSKNAINGLGKVYAGSVSSKILNNELSKLIIKTIDVKISEVVTDLTVDSTVGSEFLAFVNVYLTKTGEQHILNFVYNINTQTSVKVINEQSVGWQAVYADFLIGNI